jgi:glutaredoxin-related protein
MPALPPRPPATDRARAAQDAFHRDVVDEVVAAIAAHDIVVVGMAANPFVGRAHRALTEAGLPFHRLDYGGYLSRWKPRLALKMWSGWPTFPQVYVRGRLIGGFEDLKAGLGDGSVKAQLAQPRA